MGDKPNLCWWQDQIGPVFYCNLFYFYSPCSAFQLYKNFGNLEPVSREKNYQMPPTKPRLTMTSSQPTTKKKSMGSAFDTADEDEGGTTKWLSCGGKDCQMWTFSWVTDEYTHEKLKKQLFLCGKF